jgi:hypothetical protein
MVHEAGAVSVPPQDFFPLTSREEMPWYFLEYGISPFTRMGGETSVFKSNNNDIY